MVGPYAQAPVTLRLGAALVVQMPFAAPVAALCTSVSAQGRQRFAACVVLCLALLGDTAQHSQHSSHFAVVMLQCACLPPPRCCCQQGTGCCDQHLSAHSADASKCCVLALKGLCQQQQPYVGSRGCMQLQWAVVAACG
jgi:hypothetical protein